jgi:NADH-quinone oxidoreductase subunit L
MLSVGLILAYALYGKPGFEKTIARKLEVSRGFKAVHGFLYDRWYIQALYYKVFVSGGAKFFHTIYKRIDTGLVDRFYHGFIPWFVAKSYKIGFRFFETGGVDRFYHGLVPWFATKSYKGSFRILETDGVDRFYNKVVVTVALSLSNGFRKIQTGKINHYLLLLLIGFVVLMVLFLWG